MACRITEELRIMPTIPASHRDLLDGQFATVGPDGRPQLSEVWFLADGGAVRLSLNTTRQKTKNLLANPAVCLDRDQPGEKRVAITIRPTRINAVDMRG
jgi:Pyridoxamine 5'-phosphate oxidase